MNDLTKRPKDSFVWESNRYRRWIRDNKDCFVCGYSLLNEKPEFVTEHSFNTGGKFPRDQYLVPLCLLCHNKHHAGDPKLQFPAYIWLAQARKTLSEYVDKVLNIEPGFVMLNALAQVAEENE